MKDEKGFTYYPIKNLPTQFELEGIKEFFGLKFWVDAVNYRMVTDNNGPEFTEIFNDLLKQFHLK